MDDDHLVGIELVELGVAGMNAGDEDGVGVGQSVHLLIGRAAGRGLCGGKDLGFDLGELGGGMDGGFGGLREDRECCES